MTVYADVLIVLNMIVDYFLLLLTSRILNLSPPLWRLISGAAAGGLSSLYIFLPQAGIIAEFAVRLIFCTVITLCAFGFGGIKRLLRNSAVFFAVSMGYAGAMMALWYILKPNGMVINNSVVYFDISPIFLIAFSVAGYLISALLRRLLSSNAASAQKCLIKITAAGNTAEISAISDTGNSLEDVFGCGDIIIAEEKYADMLFGTNRSREELSKRYRAIPCNTVTGTDILEGYRCDTAEVIHQGGTVKLKSPILALSKQNLGGDYGAIINPRILQ